jgi:serine/threonine protein kinase
MAQPLLDHRYTLTRLLFETGYERHYLADHVELGITVRVVAVRPPRKSSMIDVTNFRACATQAASLRHQTLPHLRDFFLSSPIDEAYYAVFDVAEGATFAAYLAGHGGISLPLALTYGLELCDALDLVRREAPRLASLVMLSPRTLILCGTRPIGLLELGVARWLIPSALPELAPAESIYVAPEVRAGSASDSRSLLYSIAAFLYHMLMGHPLEPDHQPLKERAGGNLIPEALYTALTRALDPAPQRRFSTLDAFGIALGQAAYQVLPPSFRGRRASAGMLSAPDRARKQRKWEE